MTLLRTLGLSLLGATLLAQTAVAQTAPTPSKQRKAAPRMVPNTTPAARAADPLRGTNNNGRGNNSYAAPGEPVNVTDNGKNTPSYDGPAAGHGTLTKGMTVPRN